MLDTLGSRGDGDGNRESAYLYGLLGRVRRDVDRNDLAQSERRLPGQHSGAYPAEYVRIEHVDRRAVRTDRQVCRDLPGGDRWLGPAVGEQDRGDVPGRGVGDVGHLPVRGKGDLNRAQPDFDRRARGAGAEMDGDKESLLAVRSRQGERVVGA